uniref:Uncharacterized protein n=1 Tax=mine drainage metagenome TaxID=410659 RepID=E6PXU3_9ZZZZ
MHSIDERLHATDLDTDVPLGFRGTNPKSLFLMLKREQCFRDTIHRLLLAPAAGLTVRQGRELEVNSSWITVISMSSSIALNGIR